MEPLGAVLDQPEERAERATVATGALSALLQRLAAAPARPEPEELPAFQPGQVVGRFELVREIGRGGFGVVWEARDRELGRTVAFKAVKAGGGLDLREDRLLREAEAAARLSHPNIVTLHDVGHAREGPFLVLELLQGQTLARRLLQGALPVHETMRVAVEVARGLAHAHAHGVVHRDLTPGNVFLCDDGQVKVLDFGMAHAFGRRKLDGGTRAYMAPEQVRGAPEDERTDVFALGVVMYQMLTGDLPYATSEALEDGGPAPRLEVAGAPGLGVLVGRMLEKDAVMRPREGEEVRARLAEVQRELEPVLSTTRGAVRTRREGLPGLVRELQRRRVFRALAGWAVASFAVLQVVAPVMHGLGLPDWTLKLVVVALGLGFPITAVLAWAFDLKATGIERAAPPSTGAAGATWIRSRWWPALLLVGIGLVLAAPGVIYYLVFRDRDHAPPAPTAAESGAPGSASIAVLPFVNMSADPEQEYFSDGLASEILNALAHVPGLLVTGRTSSFSFKGKGEDLRVIGRKLNVGAVLEGSVQKAGGRVRITAQVITVRDGYHLWSETFDRELRDIFAVQDDIAAAVVAALKVRLVPGKASGADRLRPASPEVYDLYLLGRELNRRGSPEAWRRSQEALEKALALDPGYAPAWSSLASVLLNRAGSSVPAREADELRRRGLAAAEKAIAIAPDWADGFRVRGNTRARDRWDWRGAGEDFERALALAPRDFAVIADRALSLLAPLGRVTEAAAETRRALEIEPLGSIVWTSLCWLSLHDGQLESARDACRRALEISPENLYARSYEVVLSLLDGRPRAALAAAEHLPDEEARLVHVALAQHTLGDQTAARRALDELVRRYGKDAAYDVARVHAWRGEPDQAFEWLERARVQHDPDLCSVKVELARALRGDRRWRPFLEKMRLPADEQ